jgi:hypothetical protein
MKRLTNPGFYTGSFSGSISIIVACFKIGIQHPEISLTYLETVDKVSKYILLRLDWINAIIDKLTNPGHLVVRQACELISEKRLVNEHFDNDYLLNFSSTKNMLYSKVNILYKISQVRCVKMYF